jgi:hypothetical protein
MTRLWPRLAPADLWRDRSLEERAAAVEAACKAAMQILEDASDREARLHRIDPVPESTRQHLRRLASRR